MKNYILLLRPKDWAKNAFLFLPLFFSGQLFQTELLLKAAEGFICFCLVASSIYIFNDYRDIEDDKNHPVKSKRPLASGAVNKTLALVIASVLMVAGLVFAWFIRDKFFFVLSIYLVLNIAYSAGLKQIPILDIFIIAIGFVLRVKGGSVITMIPLSEWLVIMVFLLALFLALAKRRDDVLLKLKSGKDMRAAVKGYNLEFINIALSLICAVIIVAYFMYTMSGEVVQRLGTYRLYYTCLFVLAGIFRYLQLIYVQSDSESPVKILYRDRFIQATIVLWIISFYLILYVKDITIFE
ncbi:MAG: decaprenyl-phosphate phosphoribosyltransferase [Chitinophagaceae bacterium]|nr:decaprenyl-phosphate phosphoribosyltransferase [Chitinophagaceae bacterium]